MAHSRYRLTPQVEHDILAYIRAGGVPQVAAEAAGIPAAVFLDWTARPSARYRGFADAVRTAHAQARLRCEISIHEDRPLDWLKSGPGQPQAARPGWTSAVRAAPAPTDNPILLDDPAVQQFLVWLLDGLGPNPTLREEARRRLDALTQERRPPA